jgi:hypothetical protein
VVQIHPDPPIRFWILDIKFLIIENWELKTQDRSVRGHSSAGRAPALQAGGREFDPPWLHHTVRLGAGKMNFAFVGVEPPGGAVLADLQIYAAGVL